MWNEHIFRGITSMFFVCFQFSHFLAMLFRCLHSIQCFYYVALRMSVLRGVEQVSVDTHFYYGIMIVNKYTCFDLFISSHLQVCFT
jgi:hypothetical protein